MHVRHLLVIICYVAAVILAAIAAVWPPEPERSARVRLLSAAVAFLALGALIKEA